MAAALLLSVLFLAMTDHSSAVWCVCKDGVGEANLQKTLDYACGNGADCNPTHSNGPCYNPNTVKAHCNYAVNSYFQRKGQAQGSCDFSGTATVTSTDPSSAGCVYPSSASGRVLYSKHPLRWTNVFIKIRALISSHFFEICDASKVVHIVLLSYCITLFGCLAYPYFMGHPFRCYFLMLPFSGFEVASSNQLWFIAFGEYMLTRVFSFSRINSTGLTPTTPVTATNPSTTTPTTMNPRTNTPTGTTPYGSTTPAGVLGGIGTGLGPSGTSTTNTDYSHGGLRLQAISSLTTLVFSGLILSWG
ncbi:hypothetical protein V6N12_043774 [Hibiscus sabdariffa]|uniref:X8 domain-containing protein n=1 Tax=Hibiscus sabdariffa TaxID=183260 RepID=A0ABR2DI81_9ROSI